MGLRRSVRQTSPRRAFPFFFCFRFEYELKRTIFILLARSHRLASRGRGERAFSANGVETPGNRQPAVFSWARLAKLANALGLGPSTERFAGSSPASRTIFQLKNTKTAQNQPRFFFVPPVFSAEDVSVFQIPTDRARFQHAKKGTSTHPLGDVPHNQSLFRSVLSLS